eukprot:6209793-Pleurochrysis_carterae.AAC.2
MSKCCLERCVFVECWHNLGALCFDAHLILGLGVCARMLRMLLRIVSDEVVISDRAGQHHTNTATRTWPAIGRESEKSDR